MNPYPEAARIPGPKRPSNDSEHRHLMLRQQYAHQRQHVVFSLNTLLHYLSTLSFFLSPSFLRLLLRMLLQFQLTRPRVVDSTKSLRFWYILVVFFNAGAIWTHASESAAQSKSAILDFIGLEQAPSRWHLLLLDSTIVVLQWLLVTVAYEAFPSSQQQSVSPTSSSRPDAYPQLSTDLPLAEAKPSHEDEGFIMDISVHDLIRRLRAPAPTRESNDGLPLPNTTSPSLPLPAGLRLLLRARAEMHRRAQMATTGEVETRDGPRTGRIPGTMDSE